MWSRRRVWGVAVVASMAIAAASAVALNKDSLDTYACIKRIEWSVENPAKLTDLELGQLVGRWASGATVAENCFTHFRSEERSMSLADRH
jgi:hypothetical protein